MLKTASALWGLKGTQQESHFDPLVGILLGACASELEKISHDIDDTRGRTLERLVQLLYPEVLTHALPAHAIACANPTEKHITLSAETQFTHNRRIAGTSEFAQPTVKTMYFSPSGPFTLQQSSVAVIATTQQVFLITETTQKETVAVAPLRSYNPYHNSVWIALEHPQHLGNETLFYFELQNESGKAAFYDALPTSSWYQHGQALPIANRYPKGVLLHGRPDPAEIVSGKTSSMNRVLKHTNRFYLPHFITVQGLDVNAQADEWPSELKALYTPADYAKLKKQKLAWVRIDFPESIPIGNMAADLLIGLNCFPVVNRQLVTLQQKLMDYINIIPLQADDFFVDLAEVTDVAGHALNSLGNDGANSPVNVHYGGVGRFSDKDALSALEGLMQQLRDESSAFSSIGHDFLYNELRSLQQSLNKLEQELSERQLLKTDTPYLVVPDKEKTGTSNIYVKYWSTNGAMANHIKPGTPLALYKSADIQSNTVKLVTGTTGGRNSLGNQDKVLAYKTALLNKERLLTAEDIASFCRMRMALREANITVQQGYQVLEGAKRGFGKTLDVLIKVNDNEMRQLLQTGSLAFWQQDLALAIAAQGSFLMPIRVFISEE